MQFIFLSNKFYSQHATHTEILTKPTRPYACLAVKINGTMFALPLRHHIQHKYAFFTVGNCGLDFTKAVVIESPDQIAQGTPQIDQKEFNALKGKDNKIFHDFSQYIALYKKALMYSTNPHYASILKYSTLQYFHKYI